MSHSNSRDLDRQPPPSFDTPDQPDNHVPRIYFPDEDRLRRPPQKLSLPVLTTGYERNGEQWHEETDAIDYNEAGITIRLGRRVQIGTLLHLLLPLPEGLRRHKQAAREYSVYALVQGVEPPQYGKRLVALEFIGEQPPPRYHETPWATFRPNRERAERRQEAREPCAEAVTLEYFDGLMQQIKQTTGVTEDLSPSGAKVCVGQVPENFEWIKVTCLEHDFTSYAVARDHFIDEDGEAYLCLEFIESKWVPRQVEGSSGQKAGSYTGDGGTGKR